MEDVLAELPERYLLTYWGAQPAARRPRSWYKTCHVHGMGIMATLTVTHNSGWSLFHKAESIASAWQDFPDGLAAIVLSFSALEAFVSELEWLCGQDKGNVALAELALLLEALEANHASIRYKLDAIALRLTSKNFDWGSNLFQDLAHLKMLRDWCVHPKPVIGSSDKDVEDTREVKFFLDRGLIDERQVRNHSTWSTVVLVQPVAEWACRTVRAVIDEVLGSLPESNAAIRARLSWQRGSTSGANRDT